MSSYTSGGGDRHIRNACCSFRKFALELYDRPSAPPRAQDPDAKSRGIRDNTIQLRHVEPTRVALRHAAPSPSRLPDSSHRLAKNKRTDHPIFYLDTLMKTGSDSIDAVIRRRRILFTGFVARVETTRLPKCVMFGEFVGGAGCVGVEKKEWMGCLDDLRAFGINANQ